MLAPVTCQANCNEKAWNIRLSYQNLWNTSVLKQYGKRRTEKASWKYGRPNEWLVWIQSMLLKNSRNKKKTKKNQPHYTHQNFKKLPIFIAKAEHMSTPQFNPVYLTSVENCKYSCLVSLYTLQGAVAALCPALPWFLKVSVALSPPNVVHCDWEEAGEGGSCTGGAYLSGVGESPRYF